MLPDSRRGAGRAIGRAGLSLHGSWVISASRMARRALRLRARVRIVGTTCGPVVARLTPTSRLRCSSRDMGYRPGDPGRDQSAEWKPQTFMPIASNIAPKIRTTST